MCEASAQEVVASLVTRGTRVCDAGCRVLMPFGTVKAYLDERERGAGLSLVSSHEPLTVI